MWIFLKNNRKRILLALGALAILALTAFGFYSLGAKQGETRAKKNTNSMTSVLDNLKNVGKGAKETTENTVKPSLTNSSGFFRLSGSFTSNKKNTVTIKLSDGSVITLTTTEKTKYYSASPREPKPLSELKAGTNGFALGTIAANGSFTVSTIQAR